MTILLIVGLIAETIAPKVSAANEKANAARGKI